MPAKLSLVGVFAASSISMISAEVFSAGFSDANVVAFGRGVVGVDASSLEAVSIVTGALLTAWNSFMVPSVVGYDCKVVTPRSAVSSSGPPRAAKVALDSNLCFENNAALPGTDVTNLEPDAASRDRS